MIVGCCGQLNSIPPLIRKVDSGIIQKNMEYNSRSSIFRGMGNGYTEGGRSEFLFSKVVVHVLLVQYLLNALETASAKAYTFFGCTRQR